MRRVKTPRFAFLMLLTVTGLFSLPMGVMVLTSLKSPAELDANPHAWLPDRWQASNYREVVTTMPYFLYLRNTLVLCVGSVVGSVLSCSLVAYGFARLRWRGRDRWFGLLIATMLLPWQATMIPRFLLLRELGMYNSLAALIVPTFLGDAFYIFLLRQFFLSLPEDLLDAARLDGCSELGVFVRIAIPLSKPALATVALFQFVAAWNDFNGPLLYLSDPEKFPLAYGLERLVSAYSTQTHLVMAGAVLFSLPIVLLFLLTQRMFLRNTVSGSIKG